MLVLKCLGKLTSGYLWWIIKDCWVSKMPLYGRLSRVCSKLGGRGLLCPRDVRELHLRTDGRRNCFQNVLLKSNLLPSVTPDLWVSVSCHRLGCFFWRVESWHLVTQSEHATCIRGHMCSHLVFKVLYGAHVEDTLKSDNFFPATSIHRKVDLFKYKQPKF